MKRSLMVAFAILAMTSIALAADNTIGTWKLNTEKSKQPSGVSPITSLTIVREAADGGVKLSVKGERADGSKIDASETPMKYDGKEVPVTAGTLLWDTVSIRQVNANTLTEERTKKGGTYHATVRHVVSKDGKTMTSTSKGTGPDGKPFTSINVFDKQ
jgi:hypothetical protein